ncbi:DUF6978 family protein [Ligilactobacillus agilis]|uniref:DUF6978 family protein n=1 Tax=Ligilactobacillus agilis TaxID=1601 RepID=UPI001786D4CA|nr:hypothetical protein [Ligilactobacillus agilis]MCI5761465.1 hypothetical protein [Ligilactobacillus agilis]MDY4064669.1 hypothetical protein [Ligilactobacillus agilis]
MNKYDLTNLSKAEVMELIEYEKNPENLMQYHEIHEQIISTLVFKANTYRCKVKDAYNDILYILNIHTTPISTRFSIGLRFTGINKHLLRLDFGDTLRHTNNRGEADEYIVYGSHAHFNSSDDKYSNKNVIPIDKLSEFKNLKLLYDVLWEYIQYTNIKEGTDIDGTG